jgi:aminoglycoside 3-N-acetyltransferase
VIRVAIGTEVKHGYGRAQLRDDLLKLGVRKGSILIVQSSMRKVAPAEGGAALVVQALLDVLGRAGTLVVPTYTSLNSLSSRAHKEAILGMTEQAKAAYIAAMPVFDPFSSPSEGIGVLAEHVRQMSDAVRSTHPHTSFAAVGAQANEMMKVHDLDCHLGLNSPLGRLYDADADNLFLGLEYNRGCTMIHLADYLYAREREELGLKVHRRPYWARTAAADTPDKWVTFEDLELDDDHFNEVGALFEAAGEGRPGLSRGLVGAAESRLVGSRQVVGCAVEWIRANRH